MSEKMVLSSKDILAEKIALLREEFPEVFTEDKIDFDKLKEALGEEVAADRERYGLSWAGKSEAIRNVQTPSVGTLMPDREESVNFDTTENLFIEGDNLEVLKLLQKSYHGRVKMIYIDPPYNTGNEFIYPDNFREGLEDYLRYSGQVSGDGFKLSTNTETSGRYHSKWLNMMYPRLFLARNLLREDGVIFVSIDDHEVHNLRLLMNEVFGEEHFICTFAWEKRYSPPPDTKEVGYMHESLLLYRKGEPYTMGLLPFTEEQTARYKNPDNDPRGPWKAMDYTCRYTADERPNLYYPIKHPVTGEEVWPKRTRVWAFSREVHEQNVDEDRLWWGADGKSSVPAFKNFLTDIKQGRMPNSLLRHTEVGNTDEATKELRRLLPELKMTPKPVRLIKHLGQIANLRPEGDIVLDFFAGSATTAHAVLDLNKQDNGNRKFIMVQLPEPTDNFDYPTIADIGKKRMRRVIKKLNDEDSGKLTPDHDLPQDRGFKVFKLTSSNFEIWDGAEATPDTEDELAEQLRAFADNVKPDRHPEEILYEILLKAGFPLTAPVEAVQVAGEKVYAVEEGALLVCLAESINEELLRGMVELEPVRVVCLDTAFHGNDRLKTNAVLEMKDRGIEFRTV